MSPRNAARLLAMARLCASVAGLLALVALAGYVVNLPLLIHVRTGLEGMSPVTALGLLALAAAALATTSGWQRTANTGAAIAAIAGLAALTSHLLLGGDRISPWVAGALFPVQPSVIGRTSTATATGIVLVALSLSLRRRSARTADLAAALGLALAGVALLGYFYGVRDLYALAMFNSMALNTAVALCLLSAAALLVVPEDGWASVIGFDGAGGDSTRRQLAFIVLPIAIGWLLLTAVDAKRMGPAAAMALLVITTIIPLVILVLRDGRALSALERARQEKFDIQSRLAREMEQQLIAQAEALAREGDQRAKAEAAMYRAQKMEAIGQLTGGIAHDFNNLLMAIQGNLEMLQRRLPPSEDRLRRYAVNATMAADKGAKITAQLLAFSSSQALNIRAVALDTVLVKARELIGNALGPDIRLSVNLDTPGIWVKTDPDQLELAILNLAVNARDAMPEGGRIRIESSLGEKPGSGVQHAFIRVTDNGTGMPAEVAAQAIEPFFTTKELGKGTGLGLAQVYGFVRQCGGDLDIKTIVNEGTTIEITLPCTAAEAPLAQEYTPAAPEEDASTALGQPVLVIDDDDGVRNIIIDALTSAGFQVIEAADGPAGLMLLEQNQPAAAIIDFLMPGMNGAEVARAARQKRPDLPIIFVSGYSDTLALDSIAGAVVLRKPFRIAELNHALSSVLH